MDEDLFDSSGDQNGPDAPKILNFFRLSLDGAVELVCQLVIVGKVRLRAFDRALKQLKRRRCARAPEG
eukprot:4740831-Pleurochrysis_carterae.AAC.1